MVGADYTSPYIAGGYDVGRDSIHPPGRTELAGDPDRLGQIIHSRRKELGLSLQRLADQVGCGRAYLSMIETGARGEAVGTVSEGLLVKLERALAMEAGALTRAAQWKATPAGVRREVRGIAAEQRAAAAQLRALLSEGSLDETFKRGRLRALVSRLEGSGDGAATNVETGAADAACSPTATDSGGRAVATYLPVQVPLVNSVVAGYPREFTDLGYPARVADEYVLSPDVDDPDAFAARVVGDSMEPSYREGDIVVFAPNRVVKSGMDCFVRLERDGETTFKRIEIVEQVLGEGVECAAGGSTGTRLRLVALNPLYPTREVDREDVAFMCPAVSVTRRIG